MLSVTRDTHEANLTNEKLLKYGKTHARRN